MLEKILTNLKEAMKNKDKLKISTLRMLISSIKMKEIELRPEKLSDKDIIACIKNNVKSRKDSIEEFTKGNRMDLVNKEEAEVVILNEYLPKQLSELEITELAKKIIIENNALTKKDFGLVMKKLMSEYNDIIDGKLAKEILSKLLI